MPTDDASVGDVCEHLYKVINLLTTTKKPCDRIQRKDIAILIFSVFHVDAIFSLEFDRNTGFITASSLDHTKREVLQMRNLNKRRVERFIKKLDTCDYDELMADEGLFIIHDVEDGVHSYYMFYDNECDNQFCLRLHSVSMIRCIREVADYNSL